MKYTKTAFTLVELLVSLTIFAILIVCIMTVFLRTQITSANVEINRMLQENAKNIIETIAEDVKNYGIAPCDGTSTSDDQKICYDESKDDGSSKSGTILLISGSTYNPNGYKYAVYYGNAGDEINNTPLQSGPIDGSYGLKSKNDILGYKISFSGLDNSNLSGCTVQNRKDQCFLTRGIGDNDITPPIKLSNGSVKITDLMFTIYNYKVPRLQINMTIAPMEGKGYSTAITKGMELHIQTTISANYNPN